MCSYQAAVSQETGSSTRTEERFEGERLMAKFLRLPAFLIACGTLLWPADPQRIVSTTPSITELLYSLGLGDRVVGVTRFCRYPPEAQKKTIIGDYINPNIEVIASLRPDLVIVQQNPARLAERLKALHLKTLEIDQQNVPFDDAIFKSTLIVGEATGTSARAAQLIASIRAGLDAVRSKAAPYKPKRVMFVVGRSPGRVDGLIVVGRASYLNELMTTAGGENVFRDAVAPYPEVSLESVIARDPEIIVDMGEMGDNITEQYRREVTAAWRRVPSVAAVKHNQVVTVASEIYVTPGPRVAEAARALLAIFHPEAK